MRERVYLNGTWDYKIGAGEYRRQRVPFSALAVGKSECKRVFDKPISGERFFLIFEGITYSADVFLNDKHLGNMRAYGEYKFEITDLILDKNNEVRVELEDINVQFGPSEGWENYGGIIRDVYVECTGKHVISDAFWHNEVDVCNKSAECTVEIESDCPDGTEYTCVLTDCCGNVVKEYVSKDKEISFGVENLKLWSCDEPNLYTLYVSTPYDEISFKVGFKKFEKRGRVFYLNNERFFLFGVCRHDIYGGDGHTASYSRMLEDMKNIKAIGANFVRLVHYPHSKKIIEIADEIGLLVSEEPGLWWSDMKNPEIHKGSLEILKNVIVRDRNHVSIAFWLSFNECIFTNEFIRDSAMVARKYDPTRMVSGANCMSLEMTKENFKENGFDFYTMHPYTYDIGTYHEIAKVLDDMPLVFTEWGGTQTNDAPRFLKECIKNIVQLHNDDALAGASYWEWAKIYEFCRGEEACFDGVLCESLVDFNGKPTLIYDTFKNAIEEFKNPPPPECKMKVYPLALSEGEYVPFDINVAIDESKIDAAWEDMIAEATKPIEKFYYPFKAVRKIKGGNVLPQIPSEIGDLPVKLLGKPLAVNDTFEIKVGAKADELYFIGNVSMPNAYPIHGEIGDMAAEYKIVYDDGSEETVQLRNGVDVTTACMLYGPSRINPVCPNAKRVFEFSYDFDFEQYIVNCMSVKTDGTKKIDKIVINSSENYNILLYGITLGNRKIK